MMKIISIRWKNIFLLLILFLSLNIIYAQNDSQSETVIRPAIIPSELPPNEYSNLNEEDFASENSNSSPIVTNQSNSDLTSTIIDQPDPEIKKDKKLYYIMLIGIKGIIYF